VHWYTGEVFAVDLLLSGAEINVLANAATEFVSLGATTNDVGRASISRGTLYLTAPNTYNEIGLFSDVSFLKDEYCIYGTHVYIALVDSLNTLPTDDTKWFDYGPTNPGKMFDELLITKTEEPSGDLYFTVLGPDIDTIGIFNLSGAASATLRVFDATGLVATTTQAITERNLAFNDVDDGLVYEINIAGSRPACGGVVAGVAENIGEELWNVVIELVSYSKVVFDDFGRATFTRRGRAKKLTFPIWTTLSDAKNRLYELFNANDARFCMWQGAGMLIYGAYKRYTVILAQLSGAKYDLEILGDVDTE